MKENWLKVLPQLIDGKSKCCPDCGNEGMNYAVNTSDDGFGYAVLWCSKCKHAVMLSRVRANEPNLSSTIPKDLIFI